MNPHRMTSDFWDYLYQLQLNARLCDMQLCVREVAQSGDMPIMPIAHSIPVHKVVLTGSSHFFRRCLDSGELLDMYNFDGVQPQNLQLIVDYMYHQIPWDTMMANEEAAEVSRILEIIHHELSPDHPKGTDQNNVLVIQMKDSAQKGLDDQTVNQVQSAVASGKGDDMELPPGLKKGTRVFIRNLEEELKKHNIGRKKKKVIVLSSKFGEHVPVIRDTRQIAFNSPLATDTAEDVPAVSVPQTEQNPEGLITVETDHVDVTDALDTGPEGGSSSGSQQTDGTTSLVLQSSAITDTAEIHSEPVAESQTQFSVPEPDNGYQGVEPDADQYSRNTSNSESSVINFSDMSIKVAREGSCNIFHVVNTSKNGEEKCDDAGADQEGNEQTLPDRQSDDINSALVVHHLKPTDTVEETTEHEMCENTSETQSPTSVSNEANNTDPSSSAQVSTSAQLASDAQNCSSLKQTPTLVVPGSTKRQYSTRSKGLLMPNSQTSSCSLATTPTPVKGLSAKAEKAQDSNKLSKPVLQPGLSPYSTRYQGQKRVVQTPQTRGKRRRLAEEDTANTTVIVIQPEMNSVVSVMKKESEDALEVCDGRSSAQEVVGVDGIDIATPQGKSCEVVREEPVIEKVAQKSVPDIQTPMAMEIDKSLPVSKLENAETVAGVTNLQTDGTTEHTDEYGDVIPSPIEQGVIVEVPTQISNKSGVGLQRRGRKRTGQVKTKEEQLRSDSVLRTIHQGAIAERPYLCLKCNKSFKNQTGLNIHDLWKHRNVNSSETMREGQCQQECETCKKVCNSYQALVQHMRSRHLTTPTHQCEDCQQYFPTLRQYRSHRIKEHGAVLYKCDECGISFKSPEGQKIHMFKQHTEAENSHVCYICGKTFKMKHELSSHIKITHAAERAFKCQLCTRAFKNKGSLKRHLQTYHSSVKTVACPECFQLFKTQSDMQAHHKKHFREERPLAAKNKAIKNQCSKCSKCNKVFQKAYQCQAHERMVHREKETGVVYVCTMCKKSYSAKNYLMQHIRQMHLPKRHRCPQCLYEFTHAYMLRKHLPKCKGYPIINKPYRCTKCNRYFNLKGNLTRHIRSVGRCRGASHNYADYIVVLSSDSKKGQVQGHLSVAGEDGNVQDRVTLEALQASEALQQLQASGGSHVMEQNFPEMVQQDPESGEMIPEGVQIIAEATEEIVLDQEQVQFEEIEGQAIKHEFSGHIQDENLEETLSQMSTLKDIISLPHGLKTTNIKKDEYGNMVIEVSSGNYTDSSEPVITGSNMISGTSSIVTNLVEEAVDSAPDVSRLQQYIRTSSGELVVENIGVHTGGDVQVADMTTADGTYLIEEYSEEPAAVQEESVEVDSGHYVTAHHQGSSRIFQVVQDGILQQYVHTDPGVQMIQKDGTIQLIQTGTEGIQLLDAAEHEGAVILEGVEPDEQHMIIKEELVEEVVGNH